MVEIVAIREFIKLFSQRSFQSSANISIAVFNCCFLRIAKSEAIDPDQHPPVWPAPEAKVEVGLHAIHTPIATRTRDN
jgi:hypothetical protein